MSKEQEELVAIIDEIAGAAVSMSQSPQNYDTFIKARDQWIKRINAHFDYKDRLAVAIKDLHDLV